MRKKNLLKTISRSKKGNSMFLVVEKAKFKSPTGEYFRTVLSSGFGAHIDGD